MRCNTSVGSRVAGGSCQLFLGRYLEDIVVLRGFGGLKLLLRKFY